jgi:adenylate cyclase
MLAEGATVDKFIGDAALAYFGAPLSRGIEADAQAALAAARRIVLGLERLNQQWAEQGLDPWRQVVVLSAGTVICGNIGSPERQEYTVIGDAVNRASRLEAVAKQTGAPIVASSAVVELLGSSEAPLSLGEFPIRGQEVQRVYSLRTSQEAAPG